MIVTTLAGAALAGAPVEHDEETARELLRQELSKAEYVQARPTLIDQLINDFWNWVNGLSVPNASLPFDLSPLAVIVVAIVVVAIVALLVGRPALLRRRLAAGRQNVFLDDDTRTATELRAASERAAAAGDWTLAVLERFRAVARDLSDRTIISLRPGSTAHAVTSQASRAFPNDAGDLDRAATDFDAVRYLGRSGSEAAWLRTRDLDERIRRARPAELRPTVGADA
ncbi:DUF4129 domain-containing protein [Pseudoclavibacter chungangensis]|uniref:DUF4129 domain-containing protein n=1 Tax=Pseudoclavibacter chungangensis TaxID=587635 RepID=A0A7J5BYX4_9MICO|nr:DUF4129 domain-containing protein [Pseudoclavibacter chungangensis]KAB1659498.1 DUF4129 domain-containing protein [Pseudoclavibacter chungangensis]NYJ67643.1 hypothetical protein [Pseudoclavibacter chungangensis]